MSAFPVLRFLFLLFSSKIISLGVYAQIESGGYLRWKSIVKKGYNIILYYSLHA